MRPRAILFSDCLQCGGDNDLGLRAPATAVGSTNLDRSNSSNIFETSNKSVYKKNITVFGSTEIKKKFPLRYIDIKLKKNLLQSQTKSYVEKFINIEKINKSSIIEIHNRPSYVNILVSKIKNRIITLYFHNDPLSMDGSKSIEDRKKLLKNCYKIIFNSIWSKKRFLDGLETKFVNSN